MNRQELADKIRKYHNRASLSLAFTLFSLMCLCWGVYRFCSLDVTGWIPYIESLFMIVASGLIMAVCLIEHLWRRSELFECVYEMRTPSKEERELLTWAKRHGYEDPYDDDFDEALGNWEIADWDKDAPPAWAIPLLAVGGFIAMPFALASMVAYSVLRAIFLGAERDNLEVSLMDTVLGTQNYDDVDVW